MPKYLWLLLLGAAFFGGCLLDKGAVSPMTDVSPETEVTGFDNSRDNSATSSTRTSINAGPGSNINVFGGWDWGQVARVATAPTLLGAIGLWLVRRKSLERRAKEYLIHTIETFYRRPEIMAPLDNAGARETEAVAKEIKERVRKSTFSKEKGKYNAIGQRIHAGVRRVTH